MSQSPKPGQQVAEGSTVTFQVSNGPNPTVSVPAVIGLTEGQANAKLVMAGLKGHSSTASGDAPAGTVMDQTPNAGTTCRQRLHGRDRRLHGSSAHDHDHGAARAHDDHHDLRRGRAAGSFGSNGTV